MSDLHDDRGAELRQLFFETSQELLQALNEESLTLEKSPGDAEIVRSIRRTVHTLKGDSAACGFRELSELAHHFEDALGAESAAAHSALPDICFAVADVFASLLAAYRNGTPAPSTALLSQRITELAAAQPESARRQSVSAEAVAQSSNDWGASEKRAVAEAQATGLILVHVMVKIDPLCSMPIAARQLIHNAVATCGKVLVLRPDPNHPTATKHVETVIASSLSAAEIAAKCRIPTIAGEVTVEFMSGSVPAKKARQPRRKKSPALPPPSDTATVAAPSASETAPPSPTEVPASHAATHSAPEVAAPALENILRVEAGRIDSVLNLVGELIIGKSMLQQTLADFGARYPKDPLRGKLADAIAFQARVLNDLQRSVMKIRMVPVEQLFRRFPRIVRDVAIQCGREVELELDGQQTDLDKGILDALAEPLTHLVRNAVSHGIETPEQRKAAGKPERGKIRLNAFHQGNHVVVEIKDDGRGMESGKIRAKAVQLGLLTPEEAERLTESETLELIFRPGFSTAEVVTEVSGRGVGMDIVQSVLHRLKATIHIETVPGRGTAFRLKLPLTLAIIKALLFWVEHRLYAIPLNAVNQIARSMESEVHQVDNYEVLQLRDQVLPLLRLGRNPDPAIERKRCKLFVLVITVGEKKYGLIVDRLEGEEELVIKALDDRTFVTDLVNGASILGDGKVVLILNLPAVVEHVAKMRPVTRGEGHAGLLLSPEELRLVDNLGGQP